ncbi:MAG: flagellar protein FlgN [Jatrophihabitans sp.]|uniref:flagellar protein FlgN n=1 Tax=Jatrophihabitans sp. TaxID=1932789 RepID=UPI003F7E043C
MPAHGDTGDTAAEAYGAVSGLLWRERDVLEHLLFKLTQEQLVVASGSTRWLAKATDEVQAAVESMRLQEIARAVEVEHLALQLGLPGDSTLSRLSDTADEPWATLFAEHRAALRSLVLEVQALAAETSRQLAAAGRVIGETLDRLGLTSSTYDAQGGRAQVVSGSRLLDEHV